jgi:hypothetical protein
MGYNQINNDRMIDMNQNISPFITVHTSMFKLSLSRKSLLLTLYVFVILIWTYLSKGNHEVFNLGSNILSIGAYLLALYWILGTFHTIKEKQRYFWLLFGYYLR